MLRRLCQLRLAQDCSDVDEGNFSGTSWKEVFCRHSELGWDYLKASQSHWSDFTEVPKLHDPCTYHDHSDVPAVVKRARGRMCPYPYGPPLKDEDGKAMSTSKYAQQQELASFTDDSDDSDDDRLLKKTWLPPEFGRASTFVTVCPAGIPKPRMIQKWSAKSHCGGTDQALTE